MSTNATRLVKDKGGMLLEYSLLLAFLAMLVIASITALGSKISCTTEVARWAVEGAGAPVPMQGGGYYSEVRPCTGVFIPDQ